MGLPSYDPRARQSNDRQYPRMDFEERAQQSKYL